MHEAYLRLVDQKRTRWQNRAQFFGIASQMMRRVLINHARDRASAKLGGGAERLTDPARSRSGVRGPSVGDQAVLAAFDSGETSSPFDWQRIEDVQTAPVGTGWIRVRLLATRFSGSDVDSYFDALSLRSVTLTASAVTVFEGSGLPGQETTEAIFTVSLACPYHREVSASYATADTGAPGTALAGEDYLAAAGDVSFPAGTTERQVPVTVLGDGIDEPLHLLTR